MSTAETTSWRHPMVSLHRRRVERHLVPAGKAAAELGVPLDLEMIRRALSYRRWAFLLRLRRVGCVFGVIALGGAVLYVPACRPGGHLALTPAECSSVFAYFNLGTPRSFLTLLGCTLAGLWITSAWSGDFIAGCYRPLYGLLDLVTMAAAVATGEASDYTQVMHGDKLVSAVVRIRCDAQPGLYIVQWNEKGRPAKEWARYRVTPAAADCRDAAASSDGSRAGERKPWVYGPAATLVAGGIATGLWLLKRRGRPA
ncbi:hypothetical protein [Streptomyces xanthophaeus]